MAGALGQVFDGKFRVGDVETQIVRVHRVHQRRDEKALLKLDHPNIVKLLHCGSDDDYMYYELGPCLATLDQLFLKSDDARKYKGRLPHHIDGLLQLASGLEDIHSRNLVHGDIKPQNVLIAEGPTGQHEITLKWTNFGLIRSVSEAKQNSPIGRNKAWLAPELLQLARHMGNVDETNYQDGVKSDVFALGLVFGCLLLNGEHLYGSVENEIADNIVNGNPIKMQKMDGKLRDCYENDLLKKMLKNDPNERITSKEVVVQLQSIKDKLTGKEKELLEMCGSDSRLDLTGKIKELIQFGINLNAKDKDGRNALHLLCRYYSNPKLIDGIQLLIGNGIDVNATDNDGMNAMHYLCKYHSSQNLFNGIEILNQSGINAKAITNDGSNALHYLCRDNSTPNLVDAVGILMKFGVDMMIPDNAGWTAFYYSLNKVNKEMKIWFDRQKPIGEGVFGTVFKGKFGGREVAVKRVEMRHVDKREEEAMLKLNHPNIVKLLHYETDNNFMYYALELCVASLIQLFLATDDPKKYNGRMPPPIEIFHQLATGLAYIHSKNFMHRDIKPSNILIMRSGENQEEITIKWSGFDLAKSVNEKGYYSWSGVRGTRTWYAPEVLEKLINGKKAETDKFWGTDKSDVFVLGLVFGFILLEGEHLFGSSEEEIHPNIIRNDPVNMKNIDAELRKFYADDLLTKMLEYDPEKRINSKEVVKQLEYIKNKLTKKEEEFRELCDSDSTPDLLGRFNDFIRLGIDVNAKDKWGRNALHLLCQFNSNEKLIDAIELVIGGGIDVNAKDNDGMNAIHHLCESNSSKHLIDAIQILIQSGIDANAKSNDGSNALHYLCRDNSSPNLFDAIDILSEVGVDVQAKDKDGWNAFHYLYTKDKKEMKISFDRENPIGEGGFGMVYKGKFGGREVAVKRIEIHRADEREEEAMRKLDHPNIVELLYYEKDNDFMYYALELCVASLDQAFLKPDDPKKYNGRMPRLIEVFHQLATGLEHIHSKGLIHRDIKPSDILIMQRPGKYEEIIMKWSDFGLAKSVNEKGLHSWTGVRGTRTWWAPEVLEKLINGKKAENEEFWGTVKSDVFVLGLVFGFIFLEGEHLFGSSEHQIHKNIIRNDPVNMKNIDAELRKFYADDLLRKMLEYDPEKRISSREVVKQLKSIKNQLNEKEEEFRQLCARDSSPDLIGRMNDLIRLGIVVNANDSGGRNALHLLCESNSSPNLINAIQLLIQLGIDVTAKSNLGKNALHYLCKSNSSPNLINAIQLLIELGIDVTAKSNPGKNALHYLCKSNSSPNLTEAIQLLIRLGIDVNAKDNSRTNALHYLCKKISSPNFIDAIRFLIPLGINVNAIDDSGRNALLLLCQSNSNPNLIGAIQLLIQLGINGNAKDDDGKNALHYLCQFNSSPNLIGAIELLLELGNRVISNGHDARIYLQNNNRIQNKGEIVKLLDAANRDCSIIPY